jgi:predicted RNA binding protein YcfA (HicA-like mRNA interferase family)
MKRRDVEKRLAAIGATVPREGGEHTMYVCACGKDHKTAVPRHRDISSGVVASIQKQIECQERGWLQ